MRAQRWRRACLRSPYLPVATVLAGLPLLLGGAYGAAAQLGAVMGGKVTVESVFRQSAVGISTESPTAGPWVSELDLSELLAAESIVADGQIASTGGKPVYVSSRRQGSLAEPGTQPVCQLAFSVASPAGAQHPLAQKVTVRVGEIGGINLLEKVSLHKLMTTPGGVKTPRFVLGVNRGRALSIRLYMEGLDAVADAGQEIANFSLSIVPVPTQTPCG